MKAPKTIDRRKFLALSATAAGLAVQRPKRPNILLIVADDLGYSDIGCFGGEIDTPNLNSLAASGVRLAQFYSTARCCPSRASILTGQYSHKVGVGHMVRISDSGIPGQTLGERGNDCRSPETVRIPDLHVRKVACGHE
jgi:arylsulfatase